MYDATSQKWTQLAVPDAPKNPLILSVLVHDTAVFGLVAQKVFGDTAIADQKMHPAADGLPNPYVNVLLSTSEKGEEETTLGRHTQRSREI